MAQANMRLYEMNRLKSDFLATMSHELRTPLNAIIGFSDVLDSIASLDDKQRRYVRNIQPSGKVLLEMINDILDLAKIESGRMEVRLSDFRIDPVISAVRHGPPSPSAEHRLDAEIEHSLPEMFPDQARCSNSERPAVDAIEFAREAASWSVPSRRRQSARAGRGRHRRGNRRRGTAGDFREVPPGKNRHAQRRRHDPRILGQRAGAFDRQGIVQAAGRRGSSPKRVGQRQHVHRPPARRSAPARMMTS
jgi:hypothetical protein